MTWRSGIFLVCVLQCILIAECKPRRTTPNTDVESIELVRTSKKTSKNSEKDPQIQAEIAAGSYGDVLAPNEHYSMTDLYKDFARRFVPQYPYYERTKQAAEDKKAEEILDQIIKDSRTKYENEDKKLLPVKASPEFVLSVAKQSKLLEDSKAVNPTDELIRKESLRSGDYWNAVWKEDVKPKLNILRTDNQDYRPKNAAGPLPKLGSVRTKIMPGTKLYQLISLLKPISPKFLYVMNVE